VPVSPTQAGEDVGCRCGRRLEVPTLREMQHLEAVGGQEESQSRWTRTQGAVFVVGLAITILGLAIGGYFYAHLPEVGPTTPDYAAMYENISPERSWEEWKQLKEIPLGQGPQTTHLIHRAQWRQQWSIIIAGLMAAGAGVVVAGSAFFLGSSGGR